MDKYDIQLLYKYNSWANAQILDVVSKLTPAEFLQEIPSSFSSVRDTLIHILSAEWIWLRRWKGTSPSAMLTPDEFPNVETLRARWREVEAEQAAFIKQLTDASLLLLVSYTNTQGEKWKYQLGQMMTHLVNHSTYHRGHITMMMRQLGANPTPTDFLIFIDSEVD